MKLHAVVNGVLFQVTWFAAVLGGTVAGLAACAALAAHAFWRGGRGDLALAAIVGAIGLGLDTIWIYCGILDFHGTVPAPHWIVVLWVALGLSMNHSLSMLIGRPWLAAALAAVACPLSYLGGAALGAVVIPKPVLLIVVALSWAVLFACLFGAVAPFLNRQFEETA